MLQQARQNLDGDRNFKFEKVDANDKSLPFADASFDAVIANHMLSHISDRQGLFSEIRRILKPSGHLYSSTVGQKHMIEIKELISEFDWALGASWGDATDRFTLENGEAQLSSWFTNISLHRYEDALEVTEVNPLVDYITSGWFDLEEDRQELFREFVKQKMESQGGVFHVTKEPGIFEAIRI